MSGGDAGGADILARILASKSREIAAAREAKPLAVLREQARVALPVRDFVGALRQAIAGRGAGVVAEIKKASPRSAAGTLSSQPRRYHHRQRPCRGKGSGK